MKGLVRPLGRLFGDLLDSVFNIDTRVLRTQPPLFAKPGFLTTEYFLSGAAELRHRGLGGDRPGSDVTRR